MSPPRKKVQIFIVSDATGMTAERVISAVLVKTLKDFPLLKQKSK